MKIMITYSNEPSNNLIADIDEGELYSFIAHELVKVDGPETAYVDAGANGYAEFQIISKGGTSFIKENYNELKISPDEKYKTVYLTCVNPVWNNYKFYKLEDIGNDQVLATYGRIGVSSNEMFGERTHIYPKRMYWIKLMEKIKKGYVDQTDIYITDTVSQDNHTDEISDDEPEQETITARLFNLLKSFSHHFVSESCISTVVTQPMIEQSKKILNELYSLTDDVNAFNNKLLELIAVSPRKVRYLEDILARDQSDFKGIIDREENLLMSMEALATDGKKSPEKLNKDGFAENNIEIYEATDEQKEEVMRHLGNSGLTTKVRKIYRVINPEQKERFDAYLKNNHIDKVKELWHGSRNENWLSIIMNGLLLRPNAVITGKMLGDGIYFAPSSQKSWGYTSYRNSYWARGTDDIAFMGLYACAYGKPLNVTAPGNYTQDMLSVKGCNCVHAHAGTYLRNDEIVFYSEAAMLLNYIVQFE